MLQIYKQNSPVSILLHFYDIIIDLPCLRYISENTEIPILLLLISSLAVTFEFKCALRECKMLHREKFLNDSLYVCAFPLHVEMCCDVGRHVLMFMHAHSELPVSGELPMNPF